MKRSFKQLILAVCFLAYGVSAFAQDTVRFTWQGGASKWFGVVAPYNEEFTVNWGDGSIDTVLYTYPFDSLYYMHHAYPDSNAYTVVVAQKSVNCVFKWLDCSYAQITNLDLSQCSALEMLDCSNNQLTYLDLSACTALKYLYCRNNHLQLSNLYNISVMGNILYMLLGTQTLPQQMLNVGDTVDFSAQAVFGNPPVSTVFVITKNNLPASLGIDFTINNGKIAFLNFGNYKVAMTNAAITSDTIPYNLIQVVAEFTVVAANSVALDAFISPTINDTLFGTIIPVIVSIRNVGTNSLHNCILNWTINGVMQSQTMHQFINALPQGVSDTVTLGSFMLLGNDTICAWVSLPNGAVDSVTYDDTACIFVTGVTDINVVWVTVPNSIVCDTTNPQTVTAKVISKTGAVIPTVNLYIETTSGGVITYDTLAMTPQGSDLWTANIPSKTCSSDIVYTIKHPLLGMTIASGFYHICDTVPPPPIPVTGINVNPNQLTLNIGDSMPLTVSVIPHNAANQRVWCFYDDTLTNIKAWWNNSMVYGLSVGVTAIYFQTYEGGFMDSCVITVTSQYKADISGTIMRQDSSFVTSGFVELYKIHPLSWQYFDIVSVDSNGTYLFPQVEEGDFLIRYLPDSLENAFPTYYGNTEHWHLADTVTVSDSLPIQNVDIMIIPLPPSPSGSAFISGFVGDDNEGSQSISQKSVEHPAVGVDVYLQKYQSSWITLSRTLTNENGYFEFKNISAGKYQVILDIPGAKHLDNPQVININEGDTIRNIEYEITENGIVNKSGGDVGIVGTRHALPLQVYPNPVNYELKIMNYEGGVVEIFDVVGRILTNFQFSTLNSQLNIDVSHLAAGMYFLKVDNKVVRFVKE